MTIPFTKYQATGNDFILIDNRQQLPSLSHDYPSLYAWLCHRHFGIGADGLILIEPSAKAHFRMVYFNADGQLGSFCGNGGRAAFDFAHRLGLVGFEGTFEAYDGIHYACSLADDHVQLQMNVLQVPQVLDTYSYFIHTGSPHHLIFSDHDGHFSGPYPFYTTSVDNFWQLNILPTALAIRHSDYYAPAGINVNFVQLAGDDYLRMRTFERGVEAETLSCGTGVTAAGITYLHCLQAQPYGYVQIETAGGLLGLQVEEHGVYLIGKAQAVFEGTIDLGLSLQTISSTTL
jgi:diaminopimelate epimerase